MQRIALAGGIGAGKSTVSSYLASRGYFVLDADDVARDVVEPGQGAYRALVDAFGAAVLTDDLTIDRAFLADVVFHDASALRRLNAITHGPIGLELSRRLREAHGKAGFVALPLFRTEHRGLLGLDQVWAVLSDPAIALERLTTMRRMSVEDATARLSVQIPNERRAALADVTLWNNGTVDELLAQVDALLAQRGLA
ncbi:MAG: dephospho-CoA kinase [Acidobacteriota bacterium]|nr:dephospho-CoA kinase [Acidobacteriota bacterium]MDE3043411.1 dephospho-CoA kinase [Acidobacteriota bacterium]